MLLYKFFICFKFWFFRFNVNGRYVSVSGSLLSFCLLLLSFWGIFFVYILRERQLLGRGYFFWVFLFREIGGIDNKLRKRYEWKVFFFQGFRWRVFRVFCYDVNVFIFKVRICWEYSNIDGEEKEIYIIGYCFEKVRFRFQDNFV